MLNSCNNKTAIHTYRVLAATTKIRRTNVSNSETALFLFCKIRYKMQNAKLCPFHGIILTIESLALPRRQSIKDSLGFPNLLFKDTYNATVCLHCQSDGPFMTHKPTDWYLLDPINCCIHYKQLLTRILWSITIILPKSLPKLPLAQLNQRQLNGPKEIQMTDSHDMSHRLKILT